ncbi:MAG: DUF488 domain-containing protein [Gammaproteobacteria bacterium]|nr:DUF488 domain-containing protein [Gammaproteobacteria bacterium]
MFYRQKVLLALLEEFGGSLKSTDFQKYLFLYTTICEKEKSYEFIPFKFGCFSFQSYADKNKLIESGILMDADDWTIRERAFSFRKQLKNGAEKKLKLFKQKFEHLKGKELIRYVYEKYPYYAIKSVIAHEVLDENGLARIRNQVESQEDKLFATIGYEGISLEAYINKLIKNNIKLLIDVRKNPISRKYGFSKKTLKDVLFKVGIDYYHLPELGIVTEKRQSLKTIQDYERLFDDYEKYTLNKSEKELLSLCEFYNKKKRIALTCFEESHTMCHRGRIAVRMKTIDEDIKISHL